MITQNYAQKQSLKISAQQIQLLNFYALNHLEVENMIRTEVEENPFLEGQATIDTDNDTAVEDTDPNDSIDSDEAMYYNAPAHSSEYGNRQVAYQTNFKEDAKQQLHALLLDDYTVELAEYIIDSLNDKGLLDNTLEELCDDLSFKKKKWIEVTDLQKALDVLRYIEPVGLGARDIRECLLIQLSRHQDCQLASQAYRLIDEYYEDILKHKFEKICHDLQVDNNHLKGILRYIGRFNFYPINQQSSLEHKNTIIPDFLIAYNNGSIQVNLNSRKADSLYVNQALYNQMRDLSKEKTARAYAKSKIQSAKWFVDAVKQRETTMMSIMECIVDFQKEYFIDGDISNLKPMVLKDIATLSNHDISTVSRITSSRYADTHFGIIHLKSLFSESLSTQEGENISNKVIQSIIRDTIEAEDKNNPYTDQAVTTLLQKQGYKIARRTVTKYRELMNIPIAQIRSIQFES